MNLNLYTETINRYFSNSELKRLFFEDIEKFELLFANSQKNANTELYNLYVDVINDIRKWEHTYSVLKIPMPKGTDDEISINDFDAQYNIINYKQNGIKSKLITGLIKIPYPKYVTETECIMYKIDHLKGNRYFLLEVQGFIDEKDKSLKLYNLYEFVNIQEKKLIDKFVSISQAMIYINELYK